MCDSQCPDSAASPCKCVPATASELFASTLSFYAHRDNLMWSRTQIIIAVQAAVIGGAYVLGHRELVLAVCLLLLGVALTIIAMFLMARDEELREANTPLLKALGSKLSASAGCTGDAEFRLGTNGPYRAVTLCYASAQMLIAVDLGFLFWLFARANLIRCY